MTIRHTRGSLTALLVLALLSACGPAADEPGDDPAQPAPVAAPLNDADRELLAVAEQLMITQLHEQVHPRLAPLLARDPVPVQADYLAGQAAYYLGNYGEATRRLGAVLARDRDRYLTRSNALGFAHYKLGEFDRAREVFEAIAAADPQAHKARYGLGQLALTEGRLDDARGQLEAALQLSPDYVKARFALARVLDDLGETQRALAQTELLVTQWPSNEEVLYLQSQLLHRLDRGDEARVVEARRAHVYSVKERLGEAVGRIRAGEDSPMLRLALIDGYLELGDAREAVVQLRAGRTRWPDDPALAAAEQRLARELEARRAARADQDG